MTVGMPGTGIGGLFYLASALWMPLREGLRAVGRRARPRPRRLRLALRQGAIGVGALAAIWTAGWLVGVLIRVSAASGVAADGSNNDALSHAVPWSAALLTIGTLAGVLLGVELLRLIMGAPLAQSLSWHVAAARAWTELTESGRQRAATAAARAWTELTDSGRKRAVAAAAWEQLTESGRKRVAGLVARARPGSSRRKRPGGAARLALVVLGLTGLAARDAPPQAARADSALTAGQRLARAGRTDAAISAYEQWLATHPTDAAAWRELGRERLRAGRAPASVRALERALALTPDEATARRLAAARAQAGPGLEPIIAGSRDSDGIEVRRFGATADAAVADAIRLGAALSHAEVRDDVAMATVDELSLRASWRPRAALAVSALGGGVRLDSGVLPVASLRARWRGPGGATALDLRGRHDVLDASPTLVANRVRRSEARVMAQVPLLQRLRVRALGAAAELRTDSEVNHRAAGSGILAFAVTPLFEVSGQYHQAGYSEPSAAGYFAPQRSQTIELGSYVEVETESGVVMAFDVGAGVQRVAEHSVGAGPWERALRLYSLVMVPLAPGRQLALEVEAYDGLIGTESAGGAGWRQLSGSLSLRWALD